MNKLLITIMIFSIVGATSSYGMKNISKKVPKYNLFKKDFSTKSWRWSKGWNNVKNYPTSWNNKPFQKVVVPSVQDVKIENTSFINEDVDVQQRTFDVLKYGGKNMKINLSDLKQSSKFIQKIISTWKAIKDGPLRKFFESIPWLRDRKTIFGKSSFAQAKFKHEEQTGRNYWKYIFGGAVAAYLAKLFSDSAQQELAEKSKNIPFDYSLDGESAISMSAENFVALLHKYGLTVKDAVEYQCKKKEEEIYKELTKAADLTEHDWILLQNIWKLKEDFLQGHYDESNITFKGNIDSKTIDMVKSVLQKADIPFQVTVVTRDTKLFPANERDIASASTQSDFLWAVNLEKAEFTSFGFMNIELYLSDIFLKNDDVIFKLGALAHEATHLINMHGFEGIFFAEFLKYGKNFDVNKIRDCMFYLNKLREYQADILPLAVLGYAYAQEHSFRYANKWFHKNTRPDIYIPSKKLYQLASRAVELHNAEARLLRKNRMQSKK